MKMRRTPSSGWPVITIVVIVGSLLLGGGGPAGRTLSRSLYWPVVSVAIVTTLFSYLDQRRRPARKLSLINLGAVVWLLYISLPLWHFGLELPAQPGVRPIMHWWINLVVLALAAGLFFLLQFVTRSLRAENDAVEDRPERLTV
jgi:hypothetical protein